VASELDAAARRKALQAGKDAEELVASSLAAAGWDILARNWRGGGGELDVIAQRGGRLRFVEVKARSQDDPVGLDAIDRRKRRLLRQAAEAFLTLEHDLVDEVCFVVALVEDDGVTWIDDAFDG
jgi:putative endonuclease